MLDRPEPVENLTTWVYEEGSLVPTAKLCEGKSYSIVSDYLGRPAQAYDDKGELVWQVEFDIYGRIREDTFNNQPFIPFRQLGQYEDQELDGLYYNRFRYYDSNTGTYISQDPIRLAGNNPNFYAYVHDSNAWVDPFGLDVITVYHYTSDKGYKSIMGSGVIKASDPGARGKGSIKGKPKAVYVTGIPPEQLQISGNRGKMGLTGEKSTHYIAFQIDESKVKLVDPQNPTLRLYVEDNVELRDANNKLKKGVSHGKTSCK
ncbi:MULTISPECIES: RHS repeat domain-containing protein [unclassified Gilliamella]|uniref:RHS repeat domain-containing protein n=1 Tax=unclassified Gilliamella TaxID=2685620 RepID=UPI0023511703|nr:MULTISPECIES: RHS repeat-associated core domain-containing protein [unclassified Gilliamella]